MEEIEIDLWQAVLTAGACRRAAKKDWRDRVYWTDLAEAYSHQAQVLLDWDAVTWRWPQKVDR